MIRKDKLHMEKFLIKVAQDENVFDFEVTEYLHDEEDHCKFEVYLDGKLVAGLEPDKYEYLKICKNEGKIDEGVLHLVIEQLESYNIG
jgi:hypothetical protein